MDNIDVFAARSQFVNSSRKSECGYLHSRLLTTGGRHYGETSITADEIREQFSQAMSAMYQQEVPQYGTLLELVADVNLAVLENNPQLHEKW